MWVDGKPPRDKDGNELCCLLKKSLYGLRQAGHAWGECFKEFLLRDPQYDVGFKELTADPNLYVKNLVLNGKQHNTEVLRLVDFSYLQLWQLSAGCHW